MPKVIPEDEEVSVKQREQQVGWGGVGRGQSRWRKQFVHCVCMTQFSRASQSVCQDWEEGPCAHRTRSMDLHSERAVGGLD